MLTRKPLVLLIPLMLFAFLPTISQKSEAGKPLNAYTETHGVDAACNKQTPKTSSLSQCCEVAWWCHLKHKEIHKKYGSPAREHTWWLHLRCKEHQHYCQKRFKGFCGKKTVSCNKKPRCACQPPKWKCIPSGRTWRCGWADPCSGAIRGTYTVVTF